MDLTLFTPGVQLKFDLTICIYKFGARPTAMTPHRVTAHGQGEGLGPNRPPRMAKLLTLTSICPQVFSTLGQVLAVE